MRLTSALIVTLAILGAAQSAPADPCGMVPPIVVMAGSPAIERIGLQKTYAFYKNGIETFVIRPGYRGSIDNFGMLIPFPTPPAIRKVSDDIFAHVTAAVDPPEVLVDLRRYFVQGGRASEMQVMGEGLESDLAFKRDEVRVLREEAVGMYEVAVLEAGSAAALRKWMDDHGYQYPDGMDAVCDEYVAAGWCFVAVKTKIGQKAGVDPRPGQRAIDSGLPDGSTFEGNVQAMGFRFRSGEFVLPMRLSAFNEGERRNVVYILTDRPQRIRDIPSEYVVRQITGKDLYRNLTRPLPLRVLGGTFGSISEAQLQALDARRNPAPHNGHAMELFASDLRAARSGKLSHEFEELEKELLRIGERLGLRGADLDAYHHEALAEARDEALRGALEDITRMTLTVVDGDFSREVLARDNLSFTTFAMRSSDNKPARYDAKEFGPAPDRSGTLYQSGSTGDKSIWPLLFPAAGALLLGLWLTGPRRAVNGAAGSHLSVVAIVMVGLLTLSTLGLSREARHAAWIEQLGVSERAGEAVEALVAEGEAAVGPLAREAVRGDELARRGWAIVCLSGIGGEKAAHALRDICDDVAQQRVVRAWAGAALVPLARTPADFEALADLTQQLPPVARPLGERLASADTAASAETLIEMALRNPDLQASLSGPIASLGSLRLIDAMLAGQEDFVRRGAAGYVGGLSVKGDASVARDVVRALRYRRNATAVPWNGGALFLPGLPWSRDEARELGDNLIEWLIFCTRHDLQNEVQQIMNNLRSPQLMEMAGYTWPRTQNAEGWMWVWGKIFGRDDLQEMFEAQGVTNDQPFRRVLSEL